MVIPFMSFDKMHTELRSDFQAAFNEVLDSNYFILGNQLSEFEKEYSKFNNTNFTIGVGNGLEALVLSLKTFNIGSGDEVIVPSNTFIATFLAVLQTGAKPIPVEPDEDSFNINPTNIEKAITSNSKAIIPVHLYGQACEMDAIMEIANRHNLLVIEDNAQSQGAKYNNRLTGEFGDTGCTSFYPGKNIGALGDGGAVTTNSTSTSSIVKELRNYGSSEKYIHNSIGVNSRLDELQAAFLRKKLVRIPDWNIERNRIGKLYLKELDSCHELTLPKTINKATHVYHLFVIRTNKRDELQKYLSQKGITTLIHYPIPPHLQKGLTSLKFKKGDFPIAEKMAETCLSLPLYIGLSDNEVKYICNTIKKFFK